MLRTFAPSCLEYLTNACAMLRLRLQPPLVRPPRIPPAEAGCAIRNKWLQKQVAACKARRGEQK
eukprot:2702898-Rhodomonas_salina.1